MRSVLTAAGFADIELDGTTAEMWFGNDAEDAYQFVLGLMGWMLEGLDGAGRAQRTGQPARQPRRPRQRPRRLLRVGHLDDPRHPKGTDMSYFAVTREAGPRWSDGKGAFEQPAADDHGAFMNQLADEAVIVLAGPLGGSEADRIRVLLIADADDEAEIRRRLADDPWERTQQLLTVNVEPWMLMVGGDRMTVQPARRLTNVFPR